MSVQDYWVIRFGERKKLIEKLRSEIIQHFNESRESPLNEYLTMCHVYLEFIENCVRERLGVIEVDCMHRSFFREHILSHIRDFAHNEDEIVSVVGELLMWKGELIARHRGGAYFDRREQG